MRFHKYFDIINNPKLYEDKLRFKRDEFEPIIEEIQFKLKLNGIDRFDNNVKINVNLFEGYNTDELCKIFEDINKFNSQLTEIELLACRLYNINDFKIKDNIIEQSINNEIADHYKEKSENEALSNKNVAKTELEQINQSLTEIIRRNKSEKLIAGITDARENGVASINAYIAKTKADLEIKRQQANKPPPKSKGAK